MRKATQTLIVSAVLFSVATASQAAVLATQPLFAAAGEVFYCKIANVGTKEREVTIEIISSSGTVVHSSTSTLLPGRVRIQSKDGFAAQLYCRFTTQGGRRGFRAGATLGDVNTDFFGVPGS